MRGGRVQKSRAGNVNPADRDAAARRSTGRRRRDRRMRHFARRIVKGSLLAGALLASPAGNATADGPPPPPPGGPPSGPVAVPWTKEHPAEISSGGPEGRMQCPEGKE